MMNNRILGIVLLLQIALAVLLLTGRDPLSGYAEGQSLVSFDPAQVDGLRIESGGAEGESLDLRCVDSVWTTAGGFPADADRIDRLLADLQKLEGRIAVATTEASAKRLKVAQSSFERRLSLTQDGATVVELYVGSGAGAGRAHVRVAGQDAIYAVELGSYQLPVEIADWQDKTALQFELSEVDRVVFDGLTVRAEYPRKEGSIDETDGEAQDADTEASVRSEEPVWVAEGLGETESFDTAEFKQQLGRLARLVFRQAHDKDSAPAGEPINRFTIHFTDGRARDYAIYSPEETAEDANSENASAQADASAYRLKVSDYRAVFELSNAVGSPLAAAWTRENLVAQPDTAKD